MGILRYRLGIVVGSKHVVLDWKHFKLSIKTRIDNDFIVSENFLDEAVMVSEGEVALA